jgi:6-phosphogluconate dehydrogenase
MDIAMIGLGKMGANMTTRLLRGGHRVVAYDLNEEAIQAAEAGGAEGARTLDEVATKLNAPRAVWVMVPSGDPTESTVNALAERLSPGDIIIDGGNSNFKDTIRRTEYLESQGKLYIGTGVSGGEEGARHGPSIMPGGSPAAWEHVKDIFQAIAAKVEDGSPCCDWVGENGAGHFVKMVHNGIEYGDMQLICEAYSLMQAVGMTTAEMQHVFSEWNQGALNSYLIEITADILSKVDPETGQPQVDVVLDTAGQKGTGKWTVITAAELGMPVTLIGEAVFARCLSARSVRSRATRSGSSRTSARGCMPVRSAPTPRAFR